jgi:hypothetical protein
MQPALVAPVVGPPFLTEDRVAFASQLATAAPVLVVERAARDRAVSVKGQRAGTRHPRGLLELSPQAHARSSVICSCWLRRLIEIPNRFHSYCRCSSAILNMTRAAPDQLRNASSCLDVGSGGIGGHTAVR